MNIKLSSRVDRIKPSETLAITARANQLRAEGRDIISLAAGEPDFDTPEHIKKAAQDAMQAGATKYTAVSGTASLKAAIIEKFKRDNRLDYKPNEILVSNGGKQVFYNLCQALLDKGDEVIIPAPYWVSYPDMVALANATPIVIPTTQQQRFLIRPAQLEAALSAKTKLVVINSPSNPSGMAYSDSELKTLANILLKHEKTMIVTDDIYEHILFKKKTFSNILNVCPPLKPCTLVLNGVSKAYSMTGWRIGYGAGPDHLINAMINIQSQSTSNPCSIAQAAAEAALRGNQDCVKTMSHAFEERHNYLVEELNKIKGFSCPYSDGTFYVFPNVEQVIKRLPNVNDDAAFAAYLLEKANLAVVPGSPFGLAGHIRISFATSMENLKKVVERLGQLLN